MRLDKTNLKRGIRYLLLSCMIILGLISIIAIGGCNDASPETGTLAISMGDSVTEKISELWVTIEEVSVHESVDEENAGEDTGSWKTFKGEDLPEKYDLLTLKNGAFQLLGKVTLKAGHYTQIRLILGEENYVVPRDGEPEKIDLQISSQDKTGIKLTKGFDIKAGVVTELLLDWNTEKSIIEMPNDGYRLKPTIKILNIEVASTLSGMVTEDDPDNDDLIPVEGALVTATNTDDAADDTITSTGKDGGYMLILEEGTYNIVVSKTNYDDASKKQVIDSEATDITGENFVLTTI